MTGRSTVPPGSQGIEKGADMSTDRALQLSSKTVLVPFHIGSAPVAFERIFWSATKAARHRSLRSDFSVVFGLGGKAVVAQIAFPSGASASNAIPEASRNARGSDTAFRARYALRSRHLKWLFLILRHSVGRWSFPFLPRAASTSIYRVTSFLQSVLS
jgi:hypothetical protein